MVTGSDETMAIISIVQINLSLSQQGLHWEQGHSSHQYAGLKGQFHAKKATFDKLGVAFMLKTEDRELVLYTFPILH